jgi:hypothetical protein
MDTDEFMEWLGNQLQDFLELPAKTIESLEAGQRVCAEAKRKLDEMSPQTFSSTKSEFSQVWEKRKIGNFDIPFDDEYLSPLAGDILGTIDGFF